MVDNGKLVPVAQTFSPDEKIPQYYKDIDFSILLSNDEKIKKNTRANEILMFSRFEKIALNKGAINSYKHFLSVGASFAKELSKNCSCSLATAYRAIETLVELELIQPLQVLSLRKASGPAPTLYGLADVSREESIKAGQRYLKSKRRTYKHVQDIVQLCLRDAVNQEIQFKKICFIARSNHDRNFDFMDIAEQAALEMRERNIKVIGTRSTQ